MKQIIGFILSLLWVSAAQAGRECTAVSPAPAVVEQAVGLAQAVTQALDATQAQVAIVGRVGSDQSLRGIRYTHVSIALRDHPKGRWIVTHLLNSCGQAQSELYDEGLGAFYLDDVFAFESKVVVPSPRVQAALQAAVLGPLKRKLHEREYSVIANPWRTRFQNSNNWALELAASALAGPNEVSTRSTAQSWLARAGFVPNKVTIGAADRAKTRLFAANVRYSDHPENAWQTQLYEVVSGDAVLDFVLKADPQARAWVHKGSQERVVLRGAEPITAVVAPASLTPRARILAGTRGLLQGYVCRESGYLRQCQQVEPAQCESLLKNAINDCFAPISDAELLDAERSSALAVVERVGLCAVAEMDQQLGNQRKRAFTEAGQSCADFRTYK
jgi:hypothetical protein